MERAAAADVLAGAPRSLTFLFAVACGLSVANVYYAQPLLDALATDFSIARAAIGGVITATQVACALALVLLVPLGDRVDRRRLMLAQSVALCLALVVVGSAASKPLLFAGMAAVGMLGTAMTQGLIAYAAAVAAHGERGRMVGMAGSGAVIGLLLARTLAGSIAELAGWRAVYFTSAVLTLVLAAALRRCLPDAAADQTVPDPRLSYAHLLVSMLHLLIRVPVLRIRGTLGILVFACFSIFWSALVLPLSAPPYGYSMAVIGAFGLVGAAGALAAARAGRWADRGRGQRATGLALPLLLFSWLPLGYTGHSLWALVLGIVALDGAGQVVHICNQSMILAGRTQAHGRLIGCYMLFYAVGSGAGAISSTAVYALAGWTGVCLLGAAVSVAALAFWLATSRFMPERNTS
jgi:predicted MFS family arabinose efflux permease